MPARGAHDCGIYTINKIIEIQIIEDNLMDRVNLITPQIAAGNSTAFGTQERFFYKANAPW